MLRALISASLEYRVVVLLLATGLVIAGGYAVRETPWDVFPEFAPPQIVIQCEGPGLSTEEIERLVTVPIESAAERHDPFGDAAVRRPSPGCPW